MTVTTYQACPKCGETSQHNIQYTGSLDGSIEFLLLTCPTCGYQHTEKCADAKDEGVKPAISDQEYFLSQVMRGFMSRPEFEAWIKKQIRINGGRFWLAATKPAKTGKRKNAHTHGMS